MLLLAALVWGIAFVAQSEGLNYVGAFTFNTCRFILGGAVLIPCIYFLHGRKDSAWQTLSEKEKKEQTRMGIIGGICCGCILCLASCLQQFGIAQTTVGKAGFITTFYIIIVPVVGLFFKKYCGILTWIGVVIALAGLYFLCITEKMTIQRGDALILCCSFLYTGQILAIDHYNPFVDGVKMSCIQFLTGGMLGAICMFLFESPNMAMILNAAGPILYTGIMSTGVGYTLQILGQKGLNPTVAALIMSLESVFSALSGYLFLHQVLTTRELIGCALMFIAIVLAQLPDIRRKV